MYAIDSAFPDVCAAIVRRLSLSQLGYTTGLNPRSCGIVPPAAAVVYLLAAAACCPAELRLPVVESTELHMHVFIALDKTRNACDDYRTGTTISTLLRVQLY